MSISGATAAKGAAGVAVPVAGIGGVYGVDKLVKSSNSKPSDIDLLFEKKSSLLYHREDFGTSSSEYKKDEGTFGYAYGKFMRDPKKNDDTWSVKGNEIKGAEFLKTTEFKAVKNGSKELKETCEEFYKKKKSDLNTNQSLDVWAWCSPVRAEPTRVSNSLDIKQDDLKWGKDSGNGQALIDYSGDDRAWDIILNNFLKKDLEKSDKKSGIHTKFASINEIERLKKACEEAYKSEKTTTESDYGKNAIEYCVFDISITISGYPTKPS